MKVPTIRIVPPSPPHTRPPCPAFRRAPAAEPPPSSFCCAIATAVVSGRVDRDLSERLRFQVLWGVARLRAALATTQAEGGGGSSHGEQHTCAPLRPALPRATPPCRSAVPHVARRHAPAGACAACERRWWGWSRLPRLRHRAECGAGARSGPLQTRSSGAAEHRHVRVRPQVRGAVAVASRRRARWAMSLRAADLPG